MGHGNSPQNKYLAEGETLTTAQTKEQNEIRRKEKKPYV